MPDPAGRPGAEQQCRGRARADRHPAGRGSARGHRIRLRILPGAPVGRRGSPAGAVADPLRPGPWGESGAGCRSRGKPLALWSSARSSGSRRPPPAVLCRSWSRTFTIAPTCAAGSGGCRTTSRCRCHLPPDGLVITPILNGPGSARANFHDDGTLSAIHYPLLGATKVLSGEMLPPAAALESLLGMKRARILRLLDEPRHAGAAAKAIAATPGAASHHLRALEEAGLVIRERDGQHVIVHRTARGNRLARALRPLAVAPPRR